jgi:hypothetical protein
VEGVSVGSGMIIAIPYIYVCLSIRWGDVIGHVNALNRQESAAEGHIVALWMVISKWDQGVRV